MGKARLQDLPVSGRVLGSLTQVEAPPRIMTPGGTLQLPGPHGQPLSAGWNRQKSLPAHAPLMDSFCLLLLIRGQVNADWDRSAAGRHLAARRSLLRAGRGLRGCCGSRAKALRRLPPPPPRPHLSREPPASIRPPPPPTQHGRLPFPARSRRQPLHWRVAGAICPRSCAGVGDRTRRRPATPPLRPARGPPTWRPPACAGPPSPVSRLG